MLVNLYNKYGMIPKQCMGETYQSNNTTQVNNFLNRISTSVLTSCNVTYGGERVQFFRPTTTWDGLDGAPPVETNIELSFQEIEIITRERIGVGF